MRFSGRESRTFELFSPGDTRTKFTGQRHDIVAANVTIYKSLHTQAAKSDHEGRYWLGSLGTIPVGISKGCSKETNSEPFYLVHTRGRFLRRYLQLSSYGALAWRNL